MANNAEQSQVTKDDAVTIPRAEYERLFALVDALFPLGVAWASHHSFEHRQGRVNWKDPWANFHKVHREILQDAKAFLDEREKASKESET